MNKTVYLGISILENSKTKYEFCYDHIKPKYQCNAKLSYMGTDSFIIHMLKTLQMMLKKIWYMKLWKWWPQPTSKNKKMIRLIKDELGGKIMKEFVGLRPKAYS